MKTETKNPYVEVTWGSRHQVGNFYVNMFSPHVEYILLGRSLNPQTDRHIIFFFFASIFSPLSCPSDWGCNLSKSMLPNWCSLNGTAHILLQVANFYVSYPFQLYLEKIKISTLINKCPGFPGNSWQKELAKKKPQIQRTQICGLPPPLQLTWK